MVESAWLRLWRLIVAVSIAVNVPERGDAEDGSVGPQSQQYLWAGTELLLEVPAGSRVLDVGCGRAYGLRWLTSQGFRGVGLEPSRSAAQSARSSSPMIPFVQGSGNRLPFSDAAFDAAVAIESIEHTSKPEAFLREIHRALRLDGRAVFTTPLGDPASALHSKYHVQEWTEGGFRELLNSCGFGVIRQICTEPTAEERRVQDRALTVRLAALVHRLLRLPTPLPPLRTVMVLARRLPVATATYPISASVVNEPIEGVSS